MTPRNPIYHAASCRCAQCRTEHLATPAEFRLRWYHNVALISFGALLCAAYIAMTGA